VISITEKLKPYEPELGQFMYGVPPGEFEFGKLEKWVVENLRKLAALTEVEYLGRNTGGVGFQQ